MSYFVYILLCSDNTYYIGSTSNLPRRVHEHNFIKRGAHYTKLRRPVVLKYQEVFETLKEARGREAKLKKWSREAKRKLCESTA